MNERTYTADEVDAMIARALAKQREALTQPDHIPEAGEMVQPVQEPVLPVRCLMFIDKFAHDLKQRLDALA